MARLDLASSRAEADRTHPSGGCYLGSSPSLAARSFLLKKRRRKRLGLEPGKGSGNGSFPCRKAVSEANVGKPSVSKE